MLIRAAVLVGTVLLLFLSYQFINKILIQASCNPFYHNTKDLHKMMDLFAKDNDGFFPRNEFAGNGYSEKHKEQLVLHQLTENFENLDLSHFLFILNLKVEGSWIYFSGLKNTDNPKLPLLMTPESGGDRMVINIAGDLKRKSAADVERILLTAKGTPIQIPVPTSREVHRARKQNSL